MEIDLQKELNTPHYLGDDVHVHHDGYHIVLEAAQGNHRIYLDPEVLKALDQYRQFIAQLVAISTNIKEVNPNETI